jgi:hypothetical protein
MLNNGFKAAQSDQTSAQFALAREQSVVDQPHVGKDGTGLWGALQSPRTPLLPPWGTRQSEWMLRYWDRHPYNSLWQGARSGLTMRAASTPWSMNGGKILANKFQRIFRAATVGELIGWDNWIQPVFRDFLRFDGGAWIEVIGAGDPNGELTEVTGLSLLDSYNCWPTGDPEYPCVYFSRLGKYNLMHRSRVIHLVDSPDTDNLNPGYGQCALRRAIAVVERQMNEQRYISINLDDIPSSGVVIAENVTPQQVEQAYQAMQQRVQNDQPGQPGNVVWIHALNPAFPADLKNFTFSRPPEKFDWNTYVQIDVDMLALAIGVDRQDLWPLNTRSMGSGAQSEILAEKAKGKMFGHFLTLLERELNGILPESLEFAFKTSDPQQAADQASTFKMWSDGLTSAGAHLSNDEGRRLLAEQVEAVESVVTDEAGQMVSLPDVDVKPIDSSQIAAVTNPALPPTTQQAAALPATTASDSTPNASAKKDIGATREQFISSLTDLIQAGANDEITRRRAGIVMRGQLNSAGKQARNDGLVDGGVTTGLSDADLKAHATWLVQQSADVTDFLSNLYKNGLTDAQMSQHAELWANKSLQSAYYGGLQSAGSDGTYEFVGDDGKESCATCQSLKGTKMRLSEWTAQKLLPRVDTENYICGGWMCQHSLKRVDAQSSG